jgi:hypothetical protein
VFEDAGALGALVAPSAGLGVNGAGACVTDCCGGGCGCGCG